MKITFEKGEGENKTAISIEFSVNEKSIEDVIRKAEEVVKGMSNETKKEGGHSNGDEKES